MTQHTPGPWISVNYPTGNVTKIVTKRTTRKGWEPGTVIAVIAATPENANVENNARLIAAAPEMLAFIRECVKGNYSIVSANALLARIEGKES